jgi:glycosyltransferase involved in cell wall biosynthesis
VIKVSVVVPVYNPGRDIDDCIRSLLEQSLPSDEYEVIFVDDGSTDETPARLDELASTTANVHTFHIPNSGWPGRPRNVGMDNAKGEFVYFVDNDDWLGPEALERMYNRALEDDADIVIGKVVGRGKKVPRGVFRRNRKDLSMDKATAPLGLLSPHKLFRKSMLEEHGIRFPEGRRRLEDHVFVVHAYFHAKRVSVLADYPCYYWVLRGDRSNASARRWDPAGYYGNVREVLDIVDAHTEPGELRSTLKLHWYRGKILQRVGGRAFLSREEEWAREIYDAVRSIALERYGPDDEARLAFNLRVRSRLLREGTWESLRALAAAERDMKATATATQLTPRGNGLMLEVEATMIGPVTASRDDKRLLWQPPPEVDLPMQEAELDVTEEMGDSRVQVVLVSAEDQSEFIVPSENEVRLEPAEGDGPVRAVVLSRARLAPSKAAGGSALPPGRWTVRAVVTVLGFAAEVGLKDVDGMAVELVVTPEGKLREKSAAAAGAASAAKPPPAAQKKAAPKGPVGAVKKVAEPTTFFPRALRAIERRAPWVATTRRRLVHRVGAARRERQSDVAVRGGERLVKAPVFVMCSVRSGSTLLRVLLDSHSQITAPPELHLRHVAATVKKGYPEQSLKEVGLGPKRLTYLLWDRILDRELQRNGKRVLVNKTPNDVFIVSRILECWPDARFIFLLRHPGAIARSRHNARPQDSAERNAEMVLRYTEAVEQTRRTYPGLTIRYEDMTADPVRTTQKICEWLGVPWEPEMLNYSDHDHGRFKPGLGDWSGKIKSGEIQPASPPPPVEEMHESLLPMCRTWGYLDAEHTASGASQPS